MMKIRTLLLATSLSVASLAMAGAANAATSTQELNQDANQALQLLYSTNPAAASLGKSAKAVLIFPSIVKAGFVFGGAYGEGVLKHGSKIEGYYNSFTGSWGFQAGAESYGYVVFLMTGKAVDYLHSSHGWEIGVGPTVVIVDEGVAKNLSSTTLQDDAYAFIFDQKGLMAVVSVEGTKISEIRNVPKGN